MRNIWKIFRSDWQRLTASVVAVVVVMGLCLIPCLYAWFNIFSNWDPYGPDSTSNIRVAVTSEDEGDELLGVKLNIGSMVLDGRTLSAFWTRTCGIPRSSITKIRRKTPLPPRSPTRPKPPCRTRSTPRWWKP